MRHNTNAHSFATYLNSLIDLSRDGAALRGHFRTPESDEFPVLRLRNV